jgi:RNA polymerase sigma factor (sigma-70 family)
MAKQRMTDVFQQLRGLIDSLAVSDLADEALLERFIQRGDQVAFAALVRRHGELVLGVCRRRLSDPQEVEDAFQATFLVLVRKAAGLSRRSLLANWLYGVASRIAGRARHYALRRRAQFCAVAEEPVAERPCEVQRLELRGVLDEEVNQLPEKYRVPVLLCYLEGKTNEEASRLLDWPKGTVATRLARARRLLRTRLVRRGFVLSGGALVTALAPSTGAAIPPALLMATVKAGLQGAARIGATAGALSPRVAALADLAVRDLFLTKLRTLAVLLATVLALGTGAGWLYDRLLHTRPLDAAQPEIPPPGDRIQAPLVIAQMPLVLPGKDHEAPKREDEPRPGRAWSLRAHWAHRSAVNTLAFSPDGKLVASKATPGPDVKDRKPEDSCIQLHEATTGARRVVLRGMDQASSAPWLAFSPDGQTLVTAEGPGVLWDLTRAQVRATLKQTTPLERVLFSPDGKTLAMMRNDGTGLFVDWATGQIKAPLGGKSTSIVLTAAFSPDGSTFISYDMLGSLSVWDTATGKLRADRLLNTSQPGKDHFLDDFRVSAALSPDTKVLAIGTHNWPPGQVVDPEGGSVQLWNIATGKLLASIPGKWSNVAPVNLAFSPDGTVLALGNADGAIRLWDVKAAKEVVKLVGHKSRITALAFSRDGQCLASGDSDGLVRTFTLGEAREPANPKQDDLPPTKAPPGSKAPAGPKDDVAWKLQAAWAHRGTVAALAFSPDGKSVVSQACPALNESAEDVMRQSRRGFEEIRVQIHDAATGKRRAILTRLDPGARSLAFSPDGKLLALALDPPVLWDVDKACIRATLRAERTSRFPTLSPGGAQLITFSPDGKVLAVQDANGMLRVNDTATAKIKVSFRPDPEGLQSVALTFSSDSKTLLTGHFDSTVRVWATATGKLEASHTLNAGSWCSTAFSPDAATIAFAFPGARSSYGTWPRGSSGPRLRGSRNLTSR